MIIAVEGVSYAGKSTLVSHLSTHFDIDAGPRVAAGYEDRERAIHGVDDPLVRLAFFEIELRARTRQLRHLSSSRDLVLDRYYLSVLAYHSVILGLDVRLPGEGALPRKTILLVAGREAILDRMRQRPPTHRYESDIDFLMRVQTKFLALAVDRDVTTIDTSMIDQAKVGERCSALLSLFGVHQR